MSSTSAESTVVDFVRADGTLQSLSVGPDQTILAATDDADIDLRYGCREGKCVSCTARLLEGEVEYVTPPRALDEDQRAAGFVLLCVARPATDCVVEVGKHVLAEAYPSLWHSERGVEAREVRDVVEARKQLAQVEDVDVDADHLDHLRGAMAQFPNLHRVNEAYHRLHEK
ncbi:MAG: 2Fe-2S iron-sulfur cluster-binding protein [Haloarculaceae archaeon]